MKTVKTLPVYVYRNGNDCTNGGISSKHDTLYLMCDDEGFVDTPIYDPRLVTLVPNTQGTARIIPVAKYDGNGPMMGGNYAATSDSRFTRMVEEILGHRFYGAVPIHDRFESQELYEALSR